MTTINLYKYIEGASTVITPNKRDESDTPYCYRLVADEGKSITDGTIYAPCVDTHTPENYHEVEGSGDEVSAEEMKEDLEAML